jgi:hypothetical protein
MKKVSFLMFAVLLGMLACSKDDEGTEDVASQPVVKDSVTTASTVLPIVREYSPQEFLSLFAGHQWAESRIYDVFSDGHLGEEIFRNTCGLSPCVFHVLDDHSARLIVITEDPTDPVPAVDTLCTYTYAERNRLSLKFPTEVGGTQQYKEPMTVLEINDSVMRCLGPVFVKKWAPEAVNGLFVYTRIDK